MRETRVCKALHCCDLTFHGTTQPWLRLFIPPSSLELLCSSPLPFDVVKEVMTQEEGPLNETMNLNLSVTRIHIGCLCSPAL